MLTSGHLRQSQTNPCFKFISQGKSSLSPTDTCLGGEGQEGSEWRLSLPCAGWAEIDIDHIFDTCGLKHILAKSNYFIRAQLFSIIRTKEQPWLHKSRLSGPALKSHLGPA